MTGDMADSGYLTAIGLMSGTSMDGVDAALVQTDGAGVSAMGSTAFIAYEPGFRDALRSLLGPEPERVAAYHHITGELTALHADAVDAVLEDASLDRSGVDVIGFHGQTVFHDPARGVSLQIGDGQALANQTGIAVVCDFRSADVAAGGQGAPFAPLYHAALAQDLERPMAVVNIGGVANVTWLGDGAILAFDTGPGNALIDDWVSSHSRGRYDEDGKLAATGHVHQAVVDELMAHPYFSQTPPKSLDRNDFDPAPVSRLSLEDGAATLTAFTARSIARAGDHFPTLPRRWLICGGGRRNGAIMAQLSACVAGAVEPVEAVGWSGDHLEAEAFGFLAVRSIKGLPLSLPTTTGVSHPVTGGRLFQPE